MPAFPVNLDVVTTHNFHAGQAKQFFIGCLPARRGQARLIPRLINCSPGRQFLGKT